MNELLKILGRKRELMIDDVSRSEALLSEGVGGASFLVLGGAGSIGQQVVKELFKRKPKRLHVVDISENNLVELVRDVRSSLGYMEGDFQTLPLDCGGEEYAAFLSTQPPYDFIVNLSALKHVRSEKDPFTLMRMIQVNVLNTERSLRYASRSACQKYFAVSTDKAVRPANVMGATKSLMELCLMRASNQIPVSTARFANVAFSDGSLLQGFMKRIEKRQPIAAPRDVRRFFMTQAEAGQLCVMSALLAGNREVYFPKLSEDLPATDFPTIAIRVLESHGFSPCICGSEDEARGRTEELLGRRQWPCYFFDSDTTGEKEIEEFSGPEDRLVLDRYSDIAVLERPEPRQHHKLDAFLDDIQKLRKANSWNREELILLLKAVVPEFSHKEKFKFLDGRM